MLTTRPENVERLIQHLKRIKADEAVLDAPGFNMSTFMAFGEGDDFDFMEFQPADMKAKLGERRPNWCGTQACIAGHAVVLGLKSDRPETISNLGEYHTNFEQAAAVWLGVEPENEGLINGLFYTWDNSDDLDEAISKLEGLL